MLKRFYELSQKTDQDIDEIINYTEAEYGFDQAVKYLGELEEVFIQLIQNPKLGKKREEVKRGLRSISKGEHTIFSRVMSDRIRIVRVLHGSRDIPKHF
jgi:toxin ParE1/3/4